MIGSQQPTKGLEVTYSGAVTGPGKKTGTVSERVLTSNPERGVHYHSYVINRDLGSRSGDSGSPIYTIPDINGNVHIVGVYEGQFFIAGGKGRPIFSLWDEVAEDLDLKPISP